MMGMIEIDSIDVQTGRVDKFGKYCFLKMMMTLTLAFF